jgi:lysophospholipase L1-like esterase
MKTKLSFLAAIVCLPCLASGAVVTAWGDSLTAGSGGTPYPTQFAALSGTTTYNRGVGGETSTQIMNRFLAEPARWGDFTVIWSGRNNVYTEPAVVQSDIADMVAHLTTSNYLVLSVLNGNYGGYDSVGGAGYALITGLNSNLASTYGSRFVDIRSILVNSYDPALSQDVSDFARDIVPTSLRSDNIHLNTAGYKIVADTVYAAYSIPEPGTLASLGAAAWLFAVMRRRTRWTGPAS